MDKKLIDDAHTSGQSFEETYATVTQAEGITGELASAVMWGLTSQALSELKTSDLTFIVHHLSLAKTLSS